jgi:tetratricopeptide (TPR) repeat protein
VDDHKRLDELRRRVEKDPASFAFASLAEELRKTGDYDEAVRVCRTGLERHPTYLSARVTLGRTLLALQQYGDARTEIEYVLHAAPDNLLALKCLSELEAHPSAAPKPQSGDGGPEPARATPHVQAVPEPAKPDLRIQTFSAPPDVEPPVAAPVAAPEPAHVEPPVAAPVAVAVPEPAEALGAEASAEAAGPHVPEVSAEAGPLVPEVSASPNGGPPAEHPVVGELEDWQARIQADRARRTGGSL